MGIHVVTPFCRCRAILFGLMLAGTVFVTPKPAHAQEPYTLGVFPFLAPLRLEELYGPYGGVIAGAVGLPVNFRTKATYESFTQEIENQTYDVAYMQPFDYVITGSKNNYQALARFNQNLTAIVVVSEDSDIGDIKELAKKTMAMPPMSAAVSRLAVAELLGQSLNVETDVTMTHFRTHTGCLQAVLIGSADACVTNIVPLNAFLETSNHKFRTIFESIAIPMSTFAVHNRVPESERKKILAALISLKDTPEGRDLLKASGRKSGLVVADDKDYDVVRKMTQPMEMAR